MEDAFTTRQTSFRVFPSRENFKKTQTISPCQTKNVLFWYLISLFALSLFFIIWYYLRPLHSYKIFIFILWFKFHELYFNFTALLYALEYLAFFHLSREKTHLKFFIFHSIKYNLNYGMLLSLRFSRSRWCACMNCFHIPSNKSPLLSFYLIDS